VYDHFTPKEKAQIEKWAGTIEIWTPLCSTCNLLIVSRAYPVLRVRRSDTILMVVANWVTTNM